MDIIISNSGTEPIYAQITSQIKGAIMDGSLTEGEALPSIRSLANSLHVSVITTKRAYADLEEAGFIVTVPGKGSFVAGGNGDLFREEQLRGAERSLTDALARAREAGISLEELHEMLDVLSEEG